MPLLIDCYNLLHAPMPPMLAGLNESQLCHTLARTPWAGQGVTVVCDGRAGPLGLIESPVDSVDLVYSGHGRTADQVIIDLIDDDTSPRRLIVVSTDHEIRKAARRRRATSWTSDEFIHRLTRALRTPHSPGPEKPTGTLDEVQTRRWLRAFGLEDA